MRCIFVLNPMAGKRASHETLLSQVRELFPSPDDYELYYTASAKDATRFVRERAQRTPDEELCFFACGGDGTVNEVACGLAGARNAIFAVFPCGSGNDFVKSFPGADFLSLRAQLDGEVRPLDLIRCNDTYSVDICSVGLDADVNENMQRIKKWPLISPLAAYYLATAYTFFSRIGKTAEISIDGGAPVTERVMLLSAANGRCYGGGFWGAPEAKTDDGLLDICYVRKISRLKMAGLIGIYQKGEHIKDGRVIDKVAGIIEYARGKRVEIRFPSVTTINIDGEIAKSETFSAEILPGALRFLLPRGK